MLSGKAVGRVAAVLLIAGLLQGVPSYSQVSGDEPAVADPAVENCADHEDPEDYVWDSAGVIEILLNDTAIAVDGARATVDGNVLTITRAGTYSISGVLADGQIVVDSTDKGTVRLILDGADIHCSWSAAILVEKAKKTVVVLAEDTENYLSDGRSGCRGSQAEEPNAVIFSRDDLTICGAGWLSVCGDVNDGISSKDGLIIAGGTIDIDAVDDGIRGKDYLVVRGGDLLVNAGGDGLKSDNEQDDTKGYVSIEAGALNTVSGADAIQAETDILIADGQITLRLGRRHQPQGWRATVGKGISAGISVVVSGGDLNINSGDDALHSNDRLVINGGTFVLSSTDDAIHANSAVEVNGGDIQVTWCYEGIDSNAITVTGGAIQIVSSDDGIIAAEHVSIVDGVIDITAAGDAIAAQADLTIAGGQLILSSGGGSNARTTTTTSAKGIKGVGSVVIDGGDLTVDSADDAVHSDGNVTINGGVFVISAGDDGIHANADLVINGGDIHIAKSYEGMESTDANIVINGGRIRIVSSDDGINVSAGGDEFAMGWPGGWPGGGGVTPEASSDCYLYVNGGYLVIDAAGDGIDSNGAVVMTDGVVIVHGPTSNMNAALDHLSFQMTGGFLLAAGNSGMAQAPSTSSTQYSILLTFNTMLSAQTLVHIQNSSGQDILSFVPGKQYNSVAFSSQDLVKGSTYDVYYGGSSTGTASDGLYQDGTYTPGTKYASFTISSMVTNVGANTGGGGAPGGGGNVPGGGGGAVRR